MNARTQPKVAVQTDADIDQFLAGNHDEIAAKLEAARVSIERGEARDLEPLEELLADARKQAGVR
jgi:hypothetical protein